MGNLIWIRSNANSRVHFFNEIHQEFKLQETSATQMISTPEKKYIYSANLLSRKYLYLFKEIKTHVLSQLEQYDQDLQIPEGMKPLYFHFRDFDIEPGEVLMFKDVVQYDINKAYYTIARNMGLISEEYYQKYIDLPKQIRLVLIGAMATKKRIKEFREGKLISQETKEDKILRMAFKKIVFETDKILLQMSKALKNEFLMYWVDGIICKNTKKVKNIVEYYSKLNKIEFSKDQLNFVEVKNEERIKVNVHTGQRIKPFHPKRIFETKNMNL